MQPTPTQDVTLALIQQDMTYTKSGIDEIRGTLKEINARFATKEELEERLRQIEKTLRNENTVLRQRVGLVEKATWGAVAFALYSVGQILLQIATKR